MDRAKVHLPEHTMVRVFVGQNHPTIGDTVNARIRHPEYKAFLRMPNCQLANKYATNCQLANKYATNCQLVNKYHYGS